MDNQSNGLYRRLPPLGEILDGQACMGLSRMYSRPLLTDAARGVLGRLREEIRSGKHDEESLAGCLDRLSADIERELCSRLQPTLCRVVNATGVILQTNVGRAPLSEAAIQHVSEIAGGYCNLELDLETGGRGQRDVHAERLILDVLALRAGNATGSLSGDPSGIQGAMVVNNCAAATLLALNSLAEGGEVIVSRGELVEIGGGFRVPEILNKSGAVLREVGTTNRTRISDYASAITPQTRLILRVHRSNFRIEGFTEQASLAELVELGARSGVPVFEDQGTGCVLSLAEYGIREQSSWVDSAASGAALIACSGDKLLGGPQCGILVGGKPILERLRSNPLFRALRVDKLTYAALEATLLAYLAGREETIPAVAMLRLSAEEIRTRCEAWVERLRSERVYAEVVSTTSVVGGGTTPGASLPSFAVALWHAELTENLLAGVLRRLDPPIISRTSGGRVLLDLRTVDAAEDEGLIAKLASVLAEVPQGAVDRVL